MADAIGSDGVQTSDWVPVENEEGRIVTRLEFEGSVNFGGDRRSISPGTMGEGAAEDSPMFGILSFPPIDPVAGARADALWSS